MYCVKRNTTNILLRIRKLPNQGSEHRIHYLPPDPGQGANLRPNSLLNGQRLP
jgi:hypothetical protein